ncbi:hypothetical protein BC332_08483 [Capsicum chinense]|nr:hypothetical protein BC332_08483 [Capsicum chinense]
MKDLGVTDVILGIRIHRTPQRLALSQSHYIENVLDKFKYMEFGIAKAHLDVSFALRKNEGESDSKLEYARVLGCLMYIMNCTRSDIACAISKLSRYTSNPSKTHWMAMKRVLGYLKYTQDYALHYNKHPAILKGYSDANWITESNEVKSKSGYVFAIGGGVVSWKSSKQTCIARFTMKSKFIALDKAGEEAQWLWNFLEDIPYWPKPVAPKYNTVRELLSSGIITVDYVKSKDNVLDPLTKGLSREGVERTSKGMGLRPRTSQHGGVTGRNSMIYDESKRISSLLNSELPDEKRNLSHGEIVTLCSEFLIAGTDTTRTEMQVMRSSEGGGFAENALLESGDIGKFSPKNFQEKLYKEIACVVREKKSRLTEEAVKEDDLQKMPYLKAVILEGLRRHPPGNFVLPHKVMEEGELMNGYVIPKNVTINFMVADMALDPKGGEYVLANALAMLHLEYFVANLIWHFQLNPVEGDDVDLPEKQEFAIMMKNPPCARICRRVNSWSGPSIFVASHSLAYQALVQQGAVTFNRPANEIINSNYCQIHTENYGTKWRHLLRNLTSEILHPSRIKSYSNARSWVLGILIQQLRGAQDDSVKELHDLRREQENIFIPLIEARRRAKEQKTEHGEELIMAYVDTLLSLELPDEKRNLNHGEIISLCGEFLNGGTDTTSTALQWVMANLVKNPSIQEKLYQEIAGIVGEKQIKLTEEAVKEEDLQKMSYLKAVILEGLRRHPPGHFVLPHTVTEDDPMEFKPERFLVEGSDKEGFDITGSREIKMMPFGAGRRICPGYALAMLHLEYFVANLIWHFQWNPVEGDDVDLSEKLEFTVMMKNSLQARICPRIKSV